jgi:PilZ domain-containing protein
MVNIADSEPLASAPVPPSASITNRSPEPLLQETIQERRQHARLGHKVPVMLRDATGACDYFVTEDVSKGGFAFATERLYIPGEVAVVSIRCGFSPQPLEASVRIVWRKEPGKTGHRIYGAAYFRSDAGALCN